MIRYSCDAFPSARSDLPAGGLNHSFENLALSLREFIGASVRKQGIFVDNLCGFCQ